MIVCYVDFELIKMAEHTMKSLMVPCRLCKRSIV